MLYLQDHTAFKRFSYSVMIYFRIKTIKTQIDIIIYYMVNSKILKTVRYFSYLYW